MNAFVPNVGGFSANTFIAVKFSQAPKKALEPISDKEELVAWAEAEKAKLAEAESAAVYFGLENAEGEAKELQPVIAANYEESMGEQEISLAFGTKYEQGADVTVALGLGNTELSF